MRSNIIIQLVAALILLFGGVNAPAMAQTTSKPVIDKLEDIGPYLGGCIRARLMRDGKRHRGPREATLQMTFRADGSLIAPPRVSASVPAADLPDQANFITDVANAVNGCAPLSFSSGMSGAIAGRPYRFRYRITTSQDTRV